MLSDNDPRILRPVHACKYVLSGGNLSDDYLSLFCLRYKCIRRIIKSLKRTFSIKDLIARFERFFPFVFSLQKFSNLTQYFSYFYNFKFFILEILKKD